MRYEQLEHEPDNPVEVLSTQNFVTGCAVVINRPLLEFATPIPDAIVLHDWRFALLRTVASDISMSRFYNIANMQGIKLELSHWTD